MAHEVQGQGELHIVGVIGVISLLHYVQMKTWSVALILCLNIGVDPPDVVKTNPCARRECWIGDTHTPHTHTLSTSYNHTHTHCLPATTTRPHTHTHTHTDSLSTSSQKALEEIGNSLQKQYERWQPRARYKQLLDPTTDEVRKLCMALRKNAKVCGRVCDMCDMCATLCRVNVCSSITTVMECPNQLRMERSGYLIR